VPAAVPVGIVTCVEAVDDVPGVSAPTARDSSGVSDASNVRLTERKNCVAVAGGVVPP
jgi:hypothetical protein